MTQDEPPGLTASQLVSRRNVTGVLWMIAGMVVTTIMFAILKHVTEDFPATVAAFFRTFVSFLFLLPWLVRGGPQVLATKRLGGLFLRSFFGIAAFVSITYALAHLHFADVTLLSFTTPFWIILIMAMLGREQIRLRRLAATCVGFLGVLLVVRPQSGIEPAALVAIGAALFTSLAMIQLKDLTRTEPVNRIVFYFFLFGSLLLLPAALWQWQTPTLAQMLFLIGSGVAGAAGQMFLSRAYEAAEVGVVAPFDFVRLPIAAAIGFFVFAEIPDIWTVAGTVVILSSVLYITYRERVLGRERKSKTDRPPPLSE